jgi:hypothetical protein
MIETIKKSIGMVVVAAVMLGLTAPPASALCR